MKSTRFALKDGETGFLFHHARLVTDEEIIAALGLYVPDVNEHRSGWIRDEDLMRCDREQALQFALNVKAEISKYEP